MEKRHLTTVDREAIMAQVEQVDAGVSGHRDHHCVGGDRPQRAGHVHRSSHAQLIQVHPCALDQLARVARPYPDPAPDAQTPTGRRFSTPLPVGVAAWRPIAEAQAVSPQSPTFLPLLEGPDP